MDHLFQTIKSQDIASMDESVEEDSGFFDIVGVHVLLFDEIRKKHLPLLESELLMSESKMRLRACL